MATQGLKSKLERLHGSVSPQRIHPEQSRNSDASVEVERFLERHPNVAPILTDAMVSLKDHFEQLCIPVTSELLLFVDPEDGSQRLDVILAGRSASETRRVLREFTRGWWSEASLGIRSYLEFRVKLV